MLARSLEVQPPSSGRYTIYGQIGAGGMATVQYAHFVTPAGFSRPVAIKRLHPHFANDPGFASAFLDEARLSARIAHANVVATLDVLALPEEISVVMEYVHGESLAGLLGLAHARGAPLPHKIATSLLVGVLHGLHAAHETCTEHGEPLGIVHRDVSPENILVGSDGVARLLDFGIAKAKGRSRTTPTGELKGKLGYMAPEQYRGEEVDRRVDVYGASVVLWEALTGQVLFDGTSDAAVVNAVMNSTVRPPSELSPALPKALDALVLRGLARERSVRFQSARELALALERDVGVATQSEVADWLHELAGAVLQQRAAALRQLRLGPEACSREPGELGTRRLELDLAAGVPTRASAADSAPAGPRSFESGLRDGKHVRRRRWGLLALALAGAATTAWLVAALLAPAAPAPHAAHAAPAAAPAPVLPVSAPLAAPATSTAPQAAPAAAPLHADEPAARAAQQAGKQTVKARPKSARKKRDCKQPYVVDALGIRRWKRECL